MSGTVVRERVAALLAAHDAFAACDLDSLTATELLAAGDAVQTLTCQLPTQSHRILARLQAETNPRALGGKSWRDVLAARWRITTAEASRRLKLAGLLGPRRSLPGEALEPELPATAAAAAAGSITAEHVEVIRKAIKQLPGFVDAATRGRMELDWVRTALGVGPKELGDYVDLAVFLQDQDGPAPDDRERTRKRGISMGQQGRDAMSALTGNMTPELRASLEGVYAKYAAPGMCNPDDPEPCTSGTPSHAQIDNDHRSLAQRQHDALIAVLRIAMMSGELGQHNGLPVSIIVRTTVQDLESRAGIGVTAGGTRMPIRDVIRLASHAHHYLTVFDKDSGAAMNLFRGRRVASPAQRIMLIGRDGGCTKPGCTVGANGCQVHHAVADWIDDGQTNVDEMGLACRGDHRLLDADGGWTTQMNEHCEVEWIPPPHLDTGQARVNTYHRPDRLLQPDDDEPAVPDDEPADPAPPEPDMRRATDPFDFTDDVDDPAPLASEIRPQELIDFWANRVPGPFAFTDDDEPAEPGDPAPPEADQDPRFTPEPFNPWEADTPAEPGGPAPPDDQVA